MLNDVSRDDLEATTSGDITVIHFHETTIIPEGVETTADKVWACRHKG